jgi:hypothetical protein
VDGGVPGWAWQHVTQLNLVHDSWVAPMDVARVATGGPAQTLAAVGQIRPLIARRGTEHGSGLGKQRYVVEQTFALLHAFRRLRIRWEIRADIHQAFLSLACALICWRRLSSLR